MSNSSISHACKPSQPGPVLSSLKEEHLLSALEAGDFEPVLQLLYKGPRSSYITVGVDQLTPLHYACQHGRTDIVARLIMEFNYSITACSTTGQIPLHFAAKYGHLDTVQFLVDQGATASPSVPRVQPSVHVQPPTILESVHLSATDSNGNTPLHLAAAYGQLRVTEYLLHEGKCSPTVKNKKGQTPLHLAASHGHREIVQYLVEQESCDPLVRDQRSRTPCHLATQSGHLDIVKYFIHSKKFDPYCRITKSWHTNEFHIAPGSTLLHIASQQGLVSIVRYLVNEAECDPLCIDDDGVTPLHLASLCGHIAVLQFLIEEKECDPLCRNVCGNTPLHIAARSGHLSIVKYFIDIKGCDPMSKGEAGRTPIHSATQGGHLHVVKYLTNECEVPPSCCAEWNLTPLHFASYVGHVEIVRYLTEEKCCDPLCRNNSGYTPLHSAALGGNLDVVRFFTCDKGCDPLCKANDGGTPLHCAALTGQLHILKFFTRTLECDPMCRDESGKTPLHDASKKGYPSIVEYLLDEEKVDLSCRNNDGLNALHMAASNGHLGLVQFLVGCKHCDLTVKGGGLTPLEWACKYHHTDVALYLISKGGAITGDEYLQIAPTKEWAPLQPAVKVYIVGNSGSGKSTLVKSLQKENSPLFGKVFNVTGVSPDTAGIIPTEFKSRTFGKVTLYDFAGHEEYYPSHELLFESTSHSVITITLNLEDSPDDIRKALAYWKSLISNTVVSGNAHVIVLGSHSDTQSTGDMKIKSAIVSEAMKTPSALHYAGWVTLDCRKSSSAGITKLREYLQQSCKSLRIQQEFDYHNGRILNAFITTCLTGVAACTLNELLTYLLQDPHPNLEYLKDPLKLKTVCQSLNTSGHLIFLENSENPEESWLILNKESILSNVHGLLKNISQSGIISHTQLTATIEESGVGLHTDLVARYLLTMEFCTEIEPHLLKLIGGSDIPCINETCFFFPGSIREERPSNVWNHDPQFSYAFGWGLSCTQPSQFFTPRFLQVLVIHMVCKFVLNVRSDQPPVLELSMGCRLWKNGIFWRDGGGVEIIMELSKQNTTLHLALRCLKGREMSLVELRSSIIQQILSTKHHICREVKVKEYLVHPDCLQHYPTERVTELPLSHIAKVIVLRQPYVPLDDAPPTSHSSNSFLSLEKLLFFEPYHGLEASILHMLFSPQCANEWIPDNTLQQIALALKKRWRALADALQVSPTLRIEVESNDYQSDVQKCLNILRSWASRGQGTYRQLCNCLQKYSIFAGRSPIDPEFCPVEAGSASLEQATVSTNASTTHDDTSTATSTDSVNNQELDFQDLLEIGNYLLSLSKEQMYHLGMVLGLSYSKLRNMMDSSTFCDDVLAAWLRQEDQVQDIAPPTWRNLVNALHHPRIQQNAIACKIAREKGVL